MLKNAIWLFGFAVVMLLVFLPSYTKMQDIKIKNYEYKNRIDVLTKRNAQLEQEMRMLTNDPEYLEKVARQKMGLIRPGEKVYRMVPQQPVKPAVPGKTTVVKPADKK